jgi:hypothetical protein
MPKNIGKAPPQQSSLKEMWGGKRKPKDAIVEHPDASSSGKEDHMGMDDVQSETGESYVVLSLKLRADEWQRLGSAKHEESPPGSEMDVDQTKSPKSRCSVSFINAQMTDQGA